MSWECCLEKWMTRVLGHAKTEKASTQIRLKDPTEKARPAGQTALICRSFQLLDQKIQKNCC